MGNKNQLKTILSFTVIMICILLYSFFPTTNVFEEIISFFAFVFIIPILYIKIILDKSIAVSKEKNIFLQLFFGVLFGIIISIVITFLFLVFNLHNLEYKNTVLFFNKNIGLFLLNELIILFFSIFASIALGYSFLKKVLDGVKNNWIVGYVITSLLLFTDTDKWFMGIIFLLILPILRKIKMDTFITISTTLFITILIFDTLILNYII